MAMKRLFATISVGLLVVWAVTGTFCSCGRFSTPLPMSYQFHYDDQGQLTGWTNANGQTVKYELDQEGKLITIRSPEGQVTLGYDAHDNITQVEDEAGLILYRYDPFDRLVEAAYQLSPEKRILYEYDPLGRPAAVKVVGAPGSEYEVRYEYDILGNLRAVDDGEGRIEYTYRPEQRQIVRSLPNGIETTFSFSPLGELLSVCHMDASGQLIAAYTYEHDAAGQVTQVREQTAQGVKVIRYEWDQRGYLVALHLPDGSAIRYEYDAMGNRITKTDSHGTIHYQYDKYGRLIRAGEETYEYDRAGRLTASVNRGKRTRFKWNALDQLIEVQLPDRKVQYKYDYVGNLVRRSEENSVVTYLPNPLAPPGFPLAEFDDLANLTRFYIYGDSLLGFREASGRKRYFLEDGFSSIRFVTDPSGQVVGSCDYSPFAEVLHQSGEQAGGFRTAGEWRDPVTHYGFIGCRPYDSTHGRYVAPHALSVHLLSPDSFNEYAHACPQYPAPRCNQTHRSGNPRETTWGDPRKVAEEFRQDPVWKPFVWLCDKVFGAFQKMLTVNVPGAGEVPFYCGAQAEIFWAEQTGAIGRREANQLRAKIQVKAGATVAAAALLQEGYSALPKPQTIAKSLVEPGKTTWPLSYVLGKLLNKLLGKLFGQKGLTDLAIDEAGHLIRSGLDEGLPHKPFPTSTARPEDGTSAGKPSNPFGPGGDLHDPMKTVQANVGGVELSATGKFLGQLGHVQGLVYDQHSDRLVLVGDGDVHLPPMDLSYFAVAEQLVSQGYDNIWFTLDPADPQNPRGKWMKAIWGPNTPPHDLPAKLLPGTPAGTVMFEADWLLKQYSFGVVVDEDGKITPRTCRVQGFKDMFALGFERPSTGARQGWNRFWIVIGDVLMRRSGNAILFEDVQVKVNTRPMRATAAGLQDIPGARDPTAQEFARFFEEHYDQFGKESPPLAQLKEWGKVFALVKWLHQNGIPVTTDPQWVRPGQYVDKVAALSDKRERKTTYRRGNALITETRIVQLFGGDEVVARPVEIADNGSAARLSSAVMDALKAQPSRRDVLVEVEGKTLRGVVLPLTSSGQQLWEEAASQETVQREGFTYHLAPDGEVQYAEDADGTRIDYQRDSQGRLTGFAVNLRDGWKATAAHHRETTMDLTSPRGDRYTYRWSAEGHLSEVLLNGHPFARCVYDPAQRTARITYTEYVETMAFDESDRLQTWTLEPTNGKAGGTRGRVTMAYNEKGQVVQVQTDTGARLELAYENGQVRSARLAGTQLEYVWQDRERLASVRSGNFSVNYAYEGKNVKAINFQRDGAVASATFDKGLLVRVENFSGGTWSYCYDLHGALTGASDPTGAQGQYRYDADGRLVEVSLPGTRRIVYTYGPVCINARGDKEPSPIRLLQIRCFPGG
ncbi:MAG: hypothetical protein QXP27_03820 [Candidatus Methanomethyliaceae archaeon]